METNTNTNKRLDSAKDYVDKLSQHYSKLNIIRVDFGYKKPHSATMTLEEASNDMSRMFKNMRSKQSVFDDKVGYLLKQEYTEDKGMHFHAIFMYNGQKVKNDAFKGDEIGKYWEHITKDKGSFHNCNRTKYEQHGIGMLDHRDNDKRKILDEQVITYLCKDDQDIAPMKKEDKKIKAFTRGVAPKSKGNTGRPRF